MYSRRLELSVGAFMLLGALCLAFLALEVSAAGVTVGRVVGVRYDEVSAGAIVEMEISQKFSEFSEDTSASILTAG